MSAETGLQSPTAREAELAVRSLLIPVDGTALLVPNVLVSEVATLSEIAPVVKGPDWLLGTLVWRGLRIPLVSFERVTGAEVASPNRDSRAIVFNTLNGNRDLPFIAVLSQRIPRLLLVTASMLSRPEDELPQGTLDRIDMHGDEVLIPDIDFVEQLVMRSGFRVERVVG